MTDHLTYRLKQKKVNLKILIWFCVCVFNLPSFYFIFFELWAGCSCVPALPDAVLYVSCCNGSWVTHYENMPRQYKRFLHTLKLQIPLETNTCSSIVLIFAQRFDFGYTLEPIWQG